MTKTFEPIKDPGVGSKETTTYRLRKADFGEGQEQVSKDGPNSVVHAYELVWSVLTLEEAKSIRSFMDDCGGAEVFLYTFPGDVQRKYRNGPTSLIHKLGGMATLTVNIQEAFDA